MGESDYVKRKRKQIRVVQDLIKAGVPKLLRQDGERVIQQLERSILYGGPRPMPQEIQPKPFELIAEDDDITGVKTFESKQVFTTDEIDELCKCWGGSFPKEPAIKRAIFRSVEAATLRKVSQRGEVTVTTNDKGEAVAVTRTDEEHQILSIIWERKAKETKEEGKIPFLGVYALRFIFHIYDDAYSKAFDGRDFKNPCIPGTNEHYAWIAGTEEGTRKRKEGFPNAITSTKAHPCKT